MGVSSKIIQCAVGTHVPGKKPEAGPLGGDTFQKQKHIPLEGHCRHVSHTHFLKKKMSECNPQKR